MAWRRRTNRWTPRDDTPPTTAWMTGPEHAPGEGVSGPSSAPFGGIGGLSVMGDDDYRGGGDYPVESDYRGVGPRGWAPSSARVHDAVCQALADEPWLDASDILVEVDAGEVTLVGTVASRAQKRIADHLAHRVRGVRDVHNRLAVRGEPRRRLASNRPE